MAYLVGLRTTQPLYHTHVAQGSEGPYSAEVDLETITARLPQLDWSCPPLEEPQLLFRKFRQYLRGEGPCAVPALPCLEGLNATATLVYMYFDHGVATLSLETTVELPQEGDAKALAALWTNYQAQMWDVHLLSAHLADGVAGFSIGELDEAIMAALGAGRIDMTNPMADDHGPRAGSTYCETVILPAPPSAAVIAEFALKEHRHAGQEVWFAANFEFGVISTADDALLRTLNNLTDFALMASVTMADIAKVSRDALVEMRSGDDALEAPLDEKVRWLRQHFNLLQLDSLPYSVVNWVVEDAYYSAIYAAWKLDDLQQIAGQATAAATQEIHESFARKRVQTEGRLNRAIGFISIIALMGLFAQMVDYVYSNDPPGMMNRIGALLVFVGVVTAGLLVLGRKR